MNNRHVFSFLAQAMLFSTLTHSDLTGEPPVETEEERLARLRELDRLEYEKLRETNRRLEFEYRRSTARSSTPEQPPIVCAEHKWKFVRDKGGPYKRRCVICHLEAMLPEAPETRQQKRMKKRKGNQ